jgi:hypothetical protein
MLELNLANQKENKIVENQLFEHDFDDETDSDEEISKILKLHKKGVI